MAKNSVSEWSGTASDNEDVGGISILGDAPPSNFDNALRALMAQIASYTRNGGDLASAATLNLDSIDSLVLNVTGTTTVTAFTLSSGHWRVVRAISGFTITASSSLTVNGSTSRSYTCVAGELLYCLGGATTNYVWSIGKGSGSTPLSTTTISAAATADISLPSGYTSYTLRLRNIVAATSGQDLWLRLSQSGTVAVADYKHVSDRVSSNDGTSRAASDSDSKAIIAVAVDTLGQMEITIVPDAQPQVRFEGAYITNGGTLIHIDGTGYVPAVTVDAVRLQFASGNITSGTVEVYGNKI